MAMYSDCVLLGVAHRDRDLPQLGLSKQVACRTPIFRASGGAARPQPPPSPFFLLERHQIESPKRPPKKSAQGRLPQSINVEIRTELEKRVLYAL